MTSSTDPSIFNPDFLRHNNIVDANLSVREQPISTPVFSQVLFEGGLTVKALPNQTIFEQTGEHLAMGNVRCPAMAERFVELFPSSTYNAVGINPKGFQFLPGKTPAKIKMSDVLLDKGNWLLFKDIKPKVELKMVYLFEKKKIILDVAEAKKEHRHGGTAPGVLFQANIHRDLNPDQTVNRRELLSVLSSWEADLSDFRALVDKFDFQRFTS